MVTEKAATPTIIRKKRGPLPKQGRVRVTLYLDAATAEWGKHQGEGLSDLVRRLLVEAQVSANAVQSRSGAEDLYPPELRTTYQRLVERKLRRELGREEEAELSRVRERINEADRETGRGREQERSAAILDQELADLRREIEALPERK